ncbi:hypothetical protein [Methanospirillum hungatei]|jgi:hypothetical protein|uniref:hypothetical protein n=1 Tax=Methanospirillum hungatei TaxID=2203 RepID=UPI0009CC426F|nr:hypothetical protein [Methanospirillum hungatei]MBP9009166.1 hypothetical protein [Methanospirillum sp.]OQA55874.1 MAG: hypothetical protein BWY45_02024 [Euryarchaeota archaeon ADurb.Bin294]HOW05927.1 hypothetical protein [Methanospirillum hungatei]
MIDNVFEQYSNFYVICPGDGVRFLHLYDKGHGDYTKERSEWFVQDPDEFVSNFLEWKEKRKETSNQL